MRDRKGYVLITEGRSEKTIPPIAPEILNSRKPPGANRAKNPKPDKKSESS